MLGSKIKLSALSLLSVAYSLLVNAVSEGFPQGTFSFLCFGTKTTDDTMHYNFVGAEKVASVIAKLLAESDSPLGDYVVLPQ